ncbi:MAG: type II secretion system protein [Methylobacter sp.]|nr:type II secretion system protein [Methylobacter sp.]
MRQSSGFSMIELVMVIVIIGILSAAAFPRFSGNSIFQARGFADQVLATLRYAQKAAIAQHRRVCVSLNNTTPATVTLTIASFDGAGNCAVGVALTLPDRADNILTAPTDITLTRTAAVLSFDALGRPNTATAITIPNPDGAIPITVEAETGYVH